MTDHEKNLEIIRNLRLLDDDFMTICFAENIECTQLVLRIILNKDDLTVVEVHTQHTIKNLQKRSVRLDVFALDSAGTPYDIEIQRSDQGADPKRARYNSSLIDASTSQPGMSFDALPESYVIFITENDIFKHNRPIYQFERFSMEEGIPLNDGSHIIYVNSEFQDDSPIGRLMWDFRCTEPAQMHYPALAKRARHFKEDSEGVGTMCQAIEKRCQEAAAEAAARATAAAMAMAAETAMAEKKRTAQTALKLGKLSKQDVAFLFNLSLSEVEDLIKQ